MEAIEQLQEFLSTSIEFLDSVDSLRLSRGETRAVKTTSTSLVSNNRSSFVRCPNKPQEHARILKSRLKRHLENCKAYTSAAENLNQSYPPPPPVGGPPSSRLIHPPPKSENFYHRAPEAITIVYKAHEEKFDRGIAHEDDPDPTLLKEGLYRLDHPGLNEVFVYDPPAGCTNQNDPSSSNSRQTNAVELYDKHCHLIQVIKNATGASDASDAPHSNEVIMTDLSLLTPRTVGITTETVRERIQQIQKRKAEERREEILLEQLKLEREKRRRRQNDLPIDERLETPQAKALLENAGIFEADKEFIRKLLLAGRGGPWRAAIEIFEKDVKQAQEAIAELELEKEIERKREGDAAGAQGVLNEICLKIKLGEIGQENGGTRVQKPDSIAGKEGIVNIAPSAITIVAIEERTTERRIIEEIITDEKTSDEKTSGEMITGEMITSGMTTGEMMGEIITVENTGRMITIENTGGMITIENTGEMITGEETTNKKTTREKIIGEKITGGIIGEKITGGMIGEMITDEKTTGEKITGVKITGEKITRSLF
ncbi:hypothetical protein BGZ80_005690 [Entomortierella chlamydospora]|uniref:Uncharacterized protein n=1 Tax=Entomortierella chlamydospora TaxID=101097 RepID=A0A9P6N646_9FUNG|nr:hypothetical protein BGZ79_000437 [Entomortierella chlamydospora]KAG0024143.1 hypothetical protein BGZ80_005690 [Entomortierella chlamydospora]